MLDPVVLLCALAVVEAVESTDQIAGYTSYTIKGNICEAEFQIHEISVSSDSHLIDPAVAVLVFSVFDVSVDLLLGDLLTYDIYLNRHNNSSVKKSCAGEIVFPITNIILS